MPHAERCKPVPTCFPARPRKIPDYRWEVLNYESQVRYLRTPLLTPAHCPPSLARWGWTARILVLLRLASWLCLSQAVDPPPVTNPLVAGSYLGIRNVKGGSQE